MHNIARQKYKLSAIYVRDLGAVVGEMFLPDRVGGDVGCRESEVTRREREVERVADGDGQSRRDVKERDRQQSHRRR